MKRAALPLLPIALAAAAPAAAQQEEWGRQRDLVIYRDATGCTVSGAMADGTMVELRQDLSGGLSLRIGNRAWNYRAGDTYPVRLAAAAPSPAEVSAQARGFRDSQGSGVTITLTAEDLTAIGSLADIEIRIGDTSAPALTIPSMTAAGAMRRRCVVELGRADPGTGRPAATRARLLAPVVTNDDYPPAALRAEEQGRTVMRITISAQGLISSCTIRVSSGSARLDQTACSILSHRARFQPALDAAGQPTQDDYDFPIEWRIPRD